MSWTSLKCAVCMSQLFRDKPIEHCDGTCGRLHQMAKFMDENVAKFEPLCYIGIQDTEGTWTERNYLEIDKGG